MGDRTNPLQDYGNNLYRPRMGSANVGYDMDTAAAYPQPTLEQLIQMGLLVPGSAAATGAGVGGLAALLALRRFGLREGMAHGAAQIGGGYAAGTAFDANDRMIGRKPYPYPDIQLDAEGQIGGFYGKRTPLNALIGPRL
mgnify:CR=1 FL=1|jgi:hypothetical protein